MVITKIIHSAANISFDLSHDLGPTTGSDLDDKLGFVLKESFPNFLMSMVSPRVHRVSIIRPDTSDEVAIAYGIVDFYIKNCEEVFQSPNFGKFLHFQEKDLVQCTDQSIRNGLSKYPYHILSLAHKILSQDRFFAYTTHASAVLLHTVHIKTPERMISTRLGMLQWLSARLLLAVQALVDRGLPGPLASIVMEYYGEKYYLLRFRPDFMATFSDGLLKVYVGEKNICQISVCESYLFVQVFWQYLSHYISNRIPVMIALNGKEPNLESFTESEKGQYRDPQIISLSDKEWRMFVALIAAPGLACYKRAGNASKHIRYTMLQHSKVPAMMYCCFNGDRPQLHFEDSSIC